MAPRSSVRSPEVSVVVPVYFNADSLKELLARIHATMKAAGAKDWEVVFVDDASKDHSRAVLGELWRQDPRVNVVHLLRNSGSPRAVMAGMAASRGRSVAVIAADLQDPPELLGPLLERWRKGAPLVMAHRDTRDDSWGTVLFAQGYYWLFRKLISDAMPSGGFDLFLADRHVADELLQFSDKNSNLFANLIWLGYPFESISYHRQRRPHGSSRWTLAKKITYFYDSILSFTYLPLRLLTLSGIFSMIFSGLYGSTILWFRFSHGRDVQGWTSLMLVLLFYSGAILIGLGLLGEYLWRTFDVVRRQPAYVVQATYPARNRSPRRR